MVDRDIAMEGLGVLCNANMTSYQKQRRSSYSGGSLWQELLPKTLIPAVLDADEISQDSRNNFETLKLALQGSLPSNFSRLSLGSSSAVNLSGKNHIIDEDEFFDSQFDYDFTTLRDTETYWRGREVYERPCGWKRFALKVLDKYGGNEWLGNRFRSTRSVPGEWPVSYHGTSRSGAEGIIEDHYKPGPGQVYGRGIYSTPYMADAEQYARTFTSQKNGLQYKVILQNRINPNYRFKCNNNKYWLVPIPQGLSAIAEKQMVERAIRPYGLLLKEL